MIAISCIWHRQDYVTTIYICVYARWEYCIFLILRKCVCLAAYESWILILYRLTYCPRIRICFTAKCDSANAHRTQGVLRLLQGLKLGSGTMFRACILTILLQLSLLNVTHGISSDIYDDGRFLKVHNYTCNPYIELALTWSCRGEHWPTRQSMQIPITRQPAV